MDKGLGKIELRIHRKRCPYCGEIKPEYSHFIPKFSNYHENYKRRARQHYMEGLPPGRIVKALKIDFNLDIPQTTITYWINQVSEPIRKVLKETPIPSSGYWGYDEIHLRVSGKKKYAICTIDQCTNFIPIVKITDGMGRKIGRDVLKEGKRDRYTKILGLVKDGTNNLGGLFRLRGWNTIKLQTCKTHIKWNTARYVKHYSGLPVESRKPVPKKNLWILHRFYDVIDAKDETDAYIKLEVLRYTVERLKSKVLKNGFKKIEASLPKIIEHLRDPNLPSTNNKIENFNRELQYFLSLKHQMMTIQGAQRVVDYRVFRHNFRQFPIQILKFQHQFQKHKHNVQEFPKDYTMKGVVNYFKFKFKKLDLTFSKYQTFFNEFLAIL